MKKVNINIILLLIVAVIMISPFFLNPKGLFEGADGQAEKAITQIDPDYEPWFSPIYEPKSGEVESLLFTLQGCIGTGIIAYTIGLYRGKRKNAKD